VVGDDQESLARLDGVGEQSRRTVNAFQKRRRKQGSGFVFELGARADAPGGIDPREQGMHACLDERAAVGLGVGALDDPHAYFSSARGRRQKRRRSPRMVSNDAPRLSGTCTVTMPTRPAPSASGARSASSSTRWRPSGGASRSQASAPSGSARSRAPESRARPRATGSSALTDRQREAATRGAVPAPQSHRLFTVGSPRASRSALT